MQKDNWSAEEDEILIKFHKKVGNKWAKIATHIVGRTENAIKNHWNATKRRQSTRRINSRRTNYDISRSSLLQNYIQGLSINKKEYLELSSDVVVPTIVDATTLEPEYSSTITATASCDDTFNVSLQEDSSAFYYNLDMMNQFLEKNDDTSDNDLVIKKGGWDAILAFEEEIADAAFGNSSNVVSNASPDQ